MYGGQIVRPGEIELVEVPEPELTGAGQIVFQPHMACLCGSDVPYLMGEHTPCPLDVGYSLHEMVGEVVASSGGRFRAGDRVLGLPVGQRGCLERFVISEDRATPWDGRLPAARAVLAQPLGTVLYALGKLPNLVGLDVVVVGMGPMGHLHCAAIRQAGARQVIAVDALESRLARARAMGATATVCAPAAEAAGAVAELTGGCLADVVVEAVGHGDQALNPCIDLCRQEGRLLYFGVPPARIDGVRWEALFRKNITVYTSVDPVFHVHFPLAMQMIADARIDVAPVITHHIPLARIQDAFDLYRHRRDGALKVMIEF